MKKKYIYTLWLRVGDLWESHLKFDSISQVVKFENDYAGQSIRYNRTRWHLRQYGSYEYNMSSGVFMRKIVQTSI